ncbi:MAG: phenylacetate--CoA ligase family protein [Promethearchaeota archaeon]
MDETEIYEHKFNKLKRLLWFSSKYVPYYKDLFERENIHVGNIKDIETYEAEVPILTKDTVRANFDKLRATRVIFSPIIKNSTGGSTGKPMNFFLDQSELSYKKAIAMLNLTWLGWRPWEKKAYLWGASRDLEQSRRYMLEQRLKNMIYLNSFNMTQRKMHRYYHKLNRYRPKVIIGYANSLYLFAHFMKRYDLRFEAFKFSIQSSAETIYPYMRKLIEKQFNAKIFNSYGSREVSALAHECEAHKGLHVNEQINHIEIALIESNRSAKIGGGGYGKIIVTNLTNYIFPFLRYEIGDIGEFEKNVNCKCGRKFKRLKRILGRSSDFIKTPSNKLIHGEYFTHLLYLQDYIVEFQVIQESIDRLIINYVKNPEIPQGDIEPFLEKIKSQILNELDKTFKITFNKTDEIPLLPSGKYKFIVSNIDTIQI